MDTREQKIAQSFDRHTSVVANAGSGKTRALVGRYVNIIKEEAKKESDDSKNKPAEIVDRIAAITFTRKAAAEMKAKVAKKIEEAVAVASEDESQEKTKNYLENVRKNISRARITTIHGFCSRILRDSPIESGLPPGFAEADDIEIIRMREEAIFAVLETWLESKSEKRDKALKVMNLFGYSKTSDILKLLLSKPIEFEDVKKLYAEDSIEKILEKLRGNVVRRYLPKLKKVAQCLTEAAQYAQGLPISDDNREVFLAAGKGFANILNSLPNHGNIAPEEFYRLLEKFGVRASKIVNSKWDSLNKNKLKGAFDDSSYSPDSNAPIWLEEKSVKYVGAEEASELKTLFDAGKNAAYEREIASINKLIVEIAEAAREEVETEKKERALVDFDDLIIKTAKVLEDDKVRDKIVLSNLEYLLVDEFQDTDPLQYKIARTLTLDVLKRQIDGSGANLYIVGDPKQSIYSFRGADVRVFDSAKEDVFQINRDEIKPGEYAQSGEGESIKLSETERFGSVELKATFRLQPVIAAFSNVIFEKIMNEKESDFDVSYDKFICGRINAETARLLDNSKSGGDMRLDEKNGKIVLLIKTYERIEGEKVYKNDEDEAETLAKYLKNMVWGSNPAQIEDDGAFRPANFGDVAILVKTRTRLDNLTKALNFEEIPYAVHQGTSLYGTQVVSDLVALCRFLSDKNSDAALAGVLKSPFFGLSDSTLFEIAAENESLFWRKLAAYCENPSIDDDNKKLAVRAKNALEKYLDLAGHMRIAPLLRAFLEETAFLGAISGNTDKAQIEANAEKFIANAQKFEERGFVDLRDFVVTLDAAVENLSGDKQAEFAPAENAVNIMTVHAAKGLEFPIVALYSTNQRNRNSDPELVSDEYGLTYKFPTKDENGFDKNIETPLSLANNARFKSAEAAEEKRLLYVAATRPKDVLIVSATLEKGNSGEKFNRLAGFFKLIFDNYPNLREKLTPENDQSFVFDETCELEFWREGESPKRKATFPVHVEIDPVIHSIAPPKAEFEANRASETLLGEAYGGVEYEIYSPTKIMAYNENQDFYKSKYLLGLPELKEERESAGLLKNESDDALEAATTGSIIHAAFERIAAWFDAEGEIDETALESEIEEIIKENEIRVGSDSKANILAECLAAAQTPLLRNSARAVYNAKKEYKLTLPFDGDFLVGSIDAFLDGDSGGDFEIWDWKTNNIKSWEQLIETAKKYEYQMRFYAYLISKKYPMQLTIKCRLLFTKLAKSSAETDEWTYVYQFDTDDLKSFESDLKENAHDIRIFSGNY